MSHLSFTLAAAMLSFNCAVVPSTCLSAMPGTCLATTEDAGLATTGSISMANVPDTVLTAKTDSTAVLNLQSVTVSSRVASPQNSSLRIADISRESILKNAPGRTFVELIRNVPGVYPTAETGSYGDAKINIRGFKQENIAILLNGIPISGLTSGSMFWNNWMGLTDATANIQIQKGIGNSMLADNSVGGTINIITTQPTDERSAEAGLFFTGYGTKNLFLNVNSGQFGKGWAFQLMGSHSWGSSYVDCTNLSTWSYQAVLTKRFNTRHSLNFTALGSPERHQQRSSRLSWTEMDTYGTNYNKSWGWFRESDGSKSIRTLSQNTYFKPYFTLTHSYDGRNEDNTGLRVITSLYAAIADGGGYYTESTGKRIASFLATEGEGKGQIDWNAVYDYNQVTSDQYGRRAQNIMTDYIAGHTQIGLKSSAIIDVSERLNIDAGLHCQLYNTWEKERITDLLGADYWYEDYSSKSLAGLNGRNPIKHVGDYVRTDNGRDQIYMTAYGIAKYFAGAEKRSIVTLGLSASEMLLRRWDAYNYKAVNMLSDWASKAGFSAKAGILQKTGGIFSFYANAAAISRVPYANVFFPNGNNTVSKDITNEKNYMGELGLRTVGTRFKLEGTFYLACWKDKTLMSAAYKSLDEEPFKYMVTGLDALHYGTEINGSYRISKHLMLEAFASIGNWKWKNDVNATIYDPVTMRPADYIKVYADGLHVGDAPQTQLGAIFSATFLKDFSAQAEWNFNDRLWADFEPVDRTDPNDRSDSYRLPAYHLVNLGLNWSHSFKLFRLTLFANVNNLTDSKFVERGKDGVLHDQSTFTGYWANGRNFNLGFRIRL